MKLGFANISAGGREILSKTLPELYTHLGTDLDLNFYF